MWQEIWKFLADEYYWNPKIPIVSNLTGYLADSISQLIINTIMRASGILSRILLTTPIQVLCSDQFTSFYCTIQRLVIIAFLPIIGWVFMSTITGKIRERDAIASIIRLCVASIMMNLVIPFIVALLSLTNRIVSILTQSFDIMPSTSQTTDIAMAIFFVIYMFFLYKLIIYYCYRNYAILAESINFIFISILWATGKTKALDKWFKKIIKLVIIQLAHTIQLILMTFMVSAGSMSFFLQIGGLIYMYKTPEWLDEYIDNVPNLFKKGTSDYRHIKRTSAGVKSGVGKVQKLYFLAKGKIIDAFKQG